MVEMKQPLSSTGHVISSYLTFMTLAVKRLKMKQVCEYQTLFYGEIRSWCYVLLCLERLNYKLPVKNFKHEDDMY